jgi:anti-sigma factor RsiW
MVTARDGELEARRRRALDRHLVRCGACRAEQVSIEGVLRLMDQLPTEVEVPAGLQQRVLRQVRILADEDGAQARWWSLSTGLRTLAPAFAASAVVVLAILGLRGDQPSLAPAIPDQRAAAPAPAAEAVRPLATAKPHKTRIPDEPPAELASRPDLFVDLPILDNLEKMEHFDAIAGMEDADPTGADTPEPSSG